MKLFGKPADQNPSHANWQQIALSSLSIILLFTSGLIAATKAERRQQATKLVKQALHNEIYGGLNERAELLKAAQQIDTQYAPAQWHQGCVQYQ